MALGWKKISLLSFAVVGIAVLAWQVSGQSPGQVPGAADPPPEAPTASKQERSEKSTPEEKISSETPAAKEKSPAPMSETEDTLTEDLKTDIEEAAEPEPPGEAKSIEEETGEEEPTESPPQVDPKAEKSDPEPAPRTEPEPVAPAAEEPAEAPVQTEEPAAVPPPRPRPVTPQAEQRLFGTIYTARANLALFPHWTGALERYYRRRSQVAGPCQASRFNSCHMQRWDTLLNEVRGDTRLRQLNRVNLYMNKHRYIIDPINYGVAEYWAIPNEFLRKFGDCEDYAIAKYLTLRALGWSANDMKIVVLQDMNLRVLHAVLVVKFQGQNMVLDNQLTRVIEAGKVHHYKPVYSLNENGWWRHTVAS